MIRATIRNLLILSLPALLTSCKALADIIFDDDRLYYINVTDPHTGKKTPMTIGIGTGDDSRGAGDFYSLVNALKGHEKHFFIQVFKEEDMKDALIKLESSSIDYMIMYHFVESDTDLQLASCARPQIYKGEIINVPSCHYGGRYNDKYYHFIFDVEDVYDYSIVKGKGQFLKDVLLEKGRLH